QLHVRLADIRLLESRAREHIDTTLPVALLDDTRAIRVLERQDLLERVDHRDLRAERVVHVRELHPDRARADDSDARRQLLREHRLVTAPHALAVELQDRQITRPRAGCDDDVLPGDRALPILALDLDLAVAGESAPADDVLDLV